MAESLIYSELRYGDANELQSLGIWESPPDLKGANEGNEQAESKYWLIYIHGGAWRDPTETLHGIEPTINKLLATDQEPAFNARARLAGIASINYRLSPHPSHPQDRSSTPAPQLRDARHPDHIEDVAAALSFLAEKRPGFLDRYVLSGHSCGAFLAFQLLMGASAGVPSAASALLAANPPRAIVGFEGLYDLRSINTRMGGAYTELFAVPFGPDEAVWDRVSPALHRGRFGEGDDDSPGNDEDLSGEGGAASIGRKRLLAVVAQSPEDELVDMEEAATMERALRENGVQYLLFTDLKGKHRDVPQNGTDIARVLVKTLHTLDELDNLSEHLGL